MNDCNIKIDLEFGSIGDKLMQVQYRCNDIRENVDVVDLKASINQRITLPSKITLTFSNKDNNKDTILDENNNILSDLYVKILNIYLDGIKVNPVYLQKNLKLFTDSGNIINTPYVGFNGTMEIPLDTASVFQQINWFNHQASIPNSADQASRESV